MLSGVTKRNLEADARGSTRGHREEIRDGQKKIPLPACRTAGSGRCQRPETQASRSAKRSRKPRCHLLEPMAAGDASGPTRCHRTARRITAHRPHRDKKNQKKEKREKKRNKLYHFYYLALYSFEFEVVERCQGDECS